MHDYALMTIAVVQAESAIVEQLQRLATAQIVVAVSVALIALSVLAVALGVLFAIRKAIKTFDRAVEQINPRIDPLLRSASRIGEDAEHVARDVKERVGDVLSTIDDLNDRLKSGAQAVEDRVKKFSAVVEVVQSEAEELLLDAASTARGVHTAAEVMRSDRRARLRRGDEEDLEEDVEEEEEEDLFTD